MKLYQKIAQAIQALHNCKESGNKKWEERHREAIERLATDYLPSGSGFDNGSGIDLDRLERSTGERLILYTSYHHMDEGGRYDGWTEHRIIVTPSLLFGFNLRVTGRNRNGIKEYIVEVFGQILDEEV